MEPSLKYKNMRRDAQDEMEATLPKTVNKEENRILGEKSKNTVSVPKKPKAPPINL